MVKKMPEIITYDKGKKIWKKLGRNQKKKQMYFHLEILNLFFKVQLI
jgi:hypothetical protein